MISASPPSTNSCASGPPKNTAIKNAITEYAADMNVFLAYYKCEDDWKDEKKLLSLLYGNLLRGKEKHAEERWRKKVDTIVSLLNELSEMEKAGEENIDCISGCFGKIMEEIFAYRADLWEPTLRRMGFFLGKFIYLMDAYDDVEEDIKKGNYNPFSRSYIMEGFDEQVRQMLIMMIAEVCREFEKLPIIKYTDILRNILYSGVWCRFEAVSGKRKKEQEKENV